MPTPLFTSETAPRNGRPPGAKNRTTEEMRELLKYIINKNLDRLESDLEKMSPTNRWLVLNKLTQYILPALNKNDSTTTYEGGIKIQVEYSTPENITNNQLILIEDATSQIANPDRVGYETEVLSDKNINPA